MEPANQTVSEIVTRKREIDQPCHLIETNEIVENTIEQVKEVEQSNYDPRKGEIYKIVYRALMDSRPAIRKAIIQTFNEITLNMMAQNNIPIEHSYKDQEGNIMIMSEDQIRERQERLKTETVEEEKTENVMEKSKLFSCCGILRKVGGFFGKVKEALTPPDPLQNIKPFYYDFKKVHQKQQATETTQLLQNEEQEEDKKSK